MNAEDLFQFAVENARREFPSPPAPVDDADDDEVDDAPRRRLTRQERLDGLADRGCDTWDDYRGER